MICSIVVLAALIQSLQSIVSRNVSATDPAVLSATEVHTDSSYRSGLGC